MPAKDAMQNRILDAAQRRFKHYGFGKTSMAEIAADLEMSPGNLYRYFPGKIDIAVAIANEGQEKHHAQLASIAARTEVSCIERLRSLFHADMVLTYQMMETEPRSFELAELIKTERPVWINGWLARQRELIVGLLREGVANGLFDLGDLTLTAEMLQAALMKFRFPQLWTALKLPALEREFDGVTHLLLVGLAGRTGAARADHLAPCATDALTRQVLAA